MDKIGASIDDLETDINFNFIKTYSAQQNMDNSSTFSVDFDFSPYDNLDLNCKYYDEISFLEHSKNTKGLSLLNLNVQSLAAKFENLNSFLIGLSNNFTFDIICLQEIWQIGNEDLFQIDGYHPMIYKCRKNRVQGGGVAIFIRDTLTFTVLNALSIFMTRFLKACLLGWILVITN